MNKGGRPRTGSYFNCKRCNKEFYRNKVDINRDRIHFCSRVCSGATKTKEKNPAWVGGWFISDAGYKKIRVGDKYRPEHRYLLEQHLGYELERYQDVHHKDGNKLNNSLDNLQVLNKREHASLHVQLNACNY